MSENRGVKTTENKAYRSCKNAASCGSCTLISLPYEQQLKKKQEYVNSLMGKYVRVSPIVGMENPYHYRNKVHITFGSDKKGNVIYGTYKEGTHTIVPAKECLIECECARQIAATIASLMPSFKMKPYDEDRHTGFLRHILVRKSHFSSEVMLVLVAGTNVFPSKKNFVKAVTERHPEISTIIFNINDKNTSMVLGEREEVLYGKGYIEEVLCKKTFRISSKSFYQVNPVQTEKLYQKAIECAALTGKETVIDAYCGTGTIGIVAADRAKSVLGIELNKAAVSDARTNAKNNNVKNITFVCDDATKYMTRFKAATAGIKSDTAGMTKSKPDAKPNDKSGVDVVIMDPPRAGSTKEFLKAVTKMSPSRVVYVSCNPETLARDVQYLVNHGYKAQQCVPFDMFPGTEHVETVCLLSQKTPI